MRHLLLPILLVGAALLAGCQSAGDSFGDLGSSFSGAFGRNTDTYGTNRRMDVYGGTTAPSLPSIATPGLGK